MINTVPTQQPASLSPKTAPIHTAEYRGRRIVIRDSGLPAYAWCAFVDGWPVSNRRRGAPGGFPDVAQAIGRCKVVIDLEMPARRWRVALRFARRMQASVRQALTGDRRAGPRAPLAAWAPTRAANPFSASASVSARRYRQATQARQPSRSRL